jgi:hypothetical protein
MSRLLHAYHQYYRGKAIKICRRMCCSSGVRRLLIDFPLQPVCKKKLKNAVPGIEELGNTKNWPVPMPRRAILSTLHAMWTHYSLVLLSSGSYIKHAQLAPQSTPPPLLRWSQQERGSIESVFLAAMAAIDAHRVFEVAKDSCIMKSS